MLELSFLNGKSVPKAVKKVKRLTIYVDLGIVGLHPFFWRQKDKSEEVMKVDLKKYTDQQLLDEIVHVAGELAIAKSLFNWMAAAQIESQLSELRGETLQRLTTRIDPATQPITHSPRRYTDGQ